MGDITQFAVHTVPYRREARDLIIGHVGERTATRKRIESRSLKPGTKQRRRKDAQSEEEIAGREKGDGEGKRT